MLKGLSWRTAVVVAVCLFGVLSLLPNFLPQSVRDGLPGFLPNRAITLGLDLQGGSYLLLEVDVAPVFKERLESMVGDVRAGLRAARIGYRGLGVQGDTVTLTLTDPAQRDQALAEIDKLNPLSLSRPAAGSATSTSADEARPDRAAPDRRQARPSCASRRSTSRSRSCAAGSTSSARARPRSSARARTASWSRCRARRIPENIKRLLGRTARLTFHMVDLERQRRRTRCEGRVPPGSMLLESAERDGGGSRHYVVKRAGRAQRREPDRRPAHRSRTTSRW